MAKTSNKSTRKDQYRGILAKAGIRFEDCRVLAFTFERALHRDVRKEMYASCIELDPKTMARYQLETGFYGELYVYDYMCKNRPELAQQIRARNPHNR